MFVRLLHRLFEIFLHVMRRFDPFWRPAFNTTLRNPTARVLTALINLQRSRENVGLAQETLQPGEEQDVQTMIDEMRQHLVIDFPPGNEPRMHRTETIDYVIVIAGEIDMDLDGSTVHLRAGDVMVQRGTNHAWVNRGSAPARLAFVLIDAKPLGIGHPVVGGASPR